MDKRKSVFGRLYLGLFLGYYVHRNSLAVPNGEEEGEAMEKQPLKPKELEIGVVMLTEAEWLWLLNKIGNSWDYLREKIFHQLVSRPSPKER